MPFHSVTCWISCAMLRFWNDSSTSFSSGQPSSSTVATQAGSSNRYGTSAPARDAARGVGLPGPSSSVLRTSPGPEGGRSVCTVMLAISLLDVLGGARGTPRGGVRGPRGSAPGTDGCGGVRPPGDPAPGPAAPLASATADPLSGVA